VPEGGLVWDPFCRTDSVARVAARQGKHALLSDFNPLIAFAARATLNAVTPRQLDRGFAALAAAPAVQTTLEAHVNSLYATTCAVCGKPAVARTFIWSVEPARPAEKEFVCPICNDERRQPVNEEDMAILAKVDVRGRAYWTLLDRLGASEGALHALAERLLDLYPPRSLYALSTIQGTLEVLGLDRAVQETLMLALLDTMERSIKLFGDERGPRQRAGLAAPVAQGRSAGARPATFVEQNCWIVFAAAYQEQRTRLEREASAMPYLRDALPLGRTRGAGAARSEGDSPQTSVLQAAARRAAASLAEGSVHLILTSPPVLDWGDMLHLSYLWTGWLLGKDEARLFSPDYLLHPKRANDWPWFSLAMEKSLRAMLPALAPGGKVILCLPLSGLGYLNVLLLAAAAAGLRLENIAYQPSNSETVRRPPALGAIAGYCYLRLARGEASQTAASAPADVLETARREAVVAAAHLIQERGEPAAYIWIYLAAMLRLSQMGILARIAALPAAEVAPWDRLRQAQAASMQSHGGTLVFMPWAWPHETTEAKEETQEEEAGPALARQRGWWWLADALPAATPLSDRVEWAVYTVLSTSALPSTQAVARVVYALFPGLQTPEPGLVEACLQSYASPASPIHWQIRPGEALAQRGRDHTEMLTLLTNLGHRLGFRVWIGRAELRNRQHGPALNDLLTVAERYMSIEDILPDATEHSQLMDIIWYENRRASHVFEVEWTAMLGESVLRRGSRVGGLRRYVVVPAERIDLLQVKMERMPLLRRRLIEDVWLFLRFDVLRDLAARESLTADDVEAAAGFTRPVVPEGQQLALW
jgi:hypothetical protein